MKLKFAVILFAVLIFTCCNDKEYRKAHFEFVDTKTMSIDTQARLILMTMDGMIRYWNANSVEDSELEIEQNIIESYMLSLDTAIEVYCQVTDTILDSLLDNRKNNYLIHSARAANTDIHEEFKECLMGVHGNQYVLDQELAQCIVDFQILFSESHQLIQEQLQEYVQQNSRRIYAPQSGILTREY